MTSCCPSNQQMKKLLQGKHSHGKHHHIKNYAIQNDYIIGDDILGKGYFATVKTGTHRKTSEPVAIKIISKSQVSNLNFENEIGIMRKAQNPYIVSLRDVYEDSANVYIVMELVDGGELYEVIAKKKIFSEQDASTIMRQVFLALKYLHSIGIVHRDLKLENLLLADRSKLDIKIADFGLSKLYVGQALETACGTPFYVAPDILLGKGYGPPVDMWSSGIILYILLSGRLPFHSNNDAQLFRLIVSCNLVFKSPQFDSVSSSAKDLISNLLVADPQKRYNVEQALNHPFISQPSSTSALHSSLPNNIKNVSLLSHHQIHPSEYKDQ